MSTATHQHYDHYSIAMIRRLDGFFGDVDERMNQQISKWVAGKRVLEVGCGFGQLVDHLRKKGFQATGVDQLESWVTAGKNRFPDADIRLVDEPRLPFDDNSIDTLILKDTLHHIYAEADIESFMAEVKRVCRKRLIVFDPNPTFILLLSRKLIRHVDPTCSADQAEAVLHKHGFEIQHKGFSDVVAFPLSGGFVGTPFVPRFLGPLVLAVERLLESGIRLLGLQRSFCWRYIIVADKRN